MPVALLSVSDKRGLVDNLARPLHDLGWTLLASGGTARAVREGGLPVEDVAKYTGSPEILGGRVKTLHPAIHGGLLARNTESDAIDLEKIQADLIDLVAVNLYPFQKTVANPGVSLEDAIENIDIGGVALIRAAAKNYQRVTLLTNPDDYIRVVEESKSADGTILETRKQLAVAGFAYTAQYDTAITNYFSDKTILPINLYPVQTLRYGENPHQSSVLYSYEPDQGPLGGELLQGKALSYNNLLDLDAAWRAAVSYQDPTVCIIKHLSPCGIASAASLGEAYPLALASDPVSAFGSVIGVNRQFDETIAEAHTDLFVECIIAPGFTEEALEILSKKNNLRLVTMPASISDSRPELRSITHGVLQQSTDLGDPQEADWTVVSDRQPSEEEREALGFAWQACQHVKSNAIVFARGTATIGIGGGQPNRVDCVHIAAQRSGDGAVGAVMASDAFIPFPDSVEVAAGYGITAIIQPGGSIRDNASIAVANSHNMVMVLTGVRHFRH